MFADQCMYTLRIILSVGLSVVLLNNFPSFYRRYFLCKDSLCIITLYVCLLNTLFAFIWFAFFFKFKSFYSYGCCHPCYIYKTCTIIHFQILELCYAYQILAYSLRCSLVCNVLENIKYPYWKGRRLMQILRYKIRCIKNL